jgi:hypothetical protein
LAGQAYEEWSPLSPLCGGSNALKNQFIHGNNFQVVTPFKKKEWFLGGKEYWRVLYDLKNVQHDLV